MDPINAVKMFMQGAQRQNPNLDPAATAKNMLGDPNIQTGKIDRATYEKFKGMM